MLRLVKISLQCVFGCFCLSRYCRCCCCCCSLLYLCLQVECFFYPVMLMMCLLLLLVLFLIWCCCSCCLCCRDTCNRSSTNTLPCWLHVLAVWLKREAVVLLHPVCFVSAVNCCYCIWCLYACCCSFLYCLQRYHKTLLQKHVLL